MFIWVFPCPRVSSQHWTIKQPPSVNYRETQLASSYNYPVSSCWFYSTCAHAQIQKQAHSLPETIILNHSALYLICFLSGLCHIYLPIVTSPTVIYHYYTSQEEKKIIFCYGIPHVFYHSDVSAIPPLRPPWSTRTPRREGSTRPAWPSGASSAGQCPHPRTRPQ